MPTPDDARFMRIALRLSARGLGRCAPNPSVGALLVKDGHIIAQGVTANGGRPHAETIALAQAGAQARGATLYVTLEPCAHQGVTAPCTDAIMASGIARCVIACRDPNPHVNGQGIARLKQAGIEIEEAVCEKDARELHRGFFSLMDKQRPYIALKLATSLDGHMATATGESKWITGDSARRFGHLLRSRYDAIATGSGTVLADRPALTCRLPGLEECSPLRVIFDRNQHVPSDYYNAHTWIATAPSLEENIAMLAQKGITRLLVEAGPRLSAAFLESGLVDRLYWFRAPMVIPGGLPAFGGAVATSLAAQKRWQVVQSLTLSPDTLDIVECLPAS